MDPTSMMSALPSTGISPMSMMQQSDDGKEHDKQAGGANDLMKVAAQNPELVAQGAAML